MRPDLDRILLCKAYRPTHRRRIGGMKPARNVGEIDVWHHRRIVTDPIQAKALAHIAIYGQTHARDLKRHSWWPSLNSPASRFDFLLKLLHTALISRELTRATGADAGTRTRTAILPRDFKSLASTIPPRPRGKSQLTRRRAADEPTRRRVTLIR